MVDVNILAFGVYYCKGGVPPRPSWTRHQHTTYPFVLTITTIPGLDSVRLSNLRAPQGHVSNRFLYTTT
jgi:hypothetical protein